MSPHANSWPQHSWTHNSKSGKGWVIFIALATALFAFIAVKFDSPADAAVKPSITLDQCSNSPLTCDGANPSNWQNGNLGSSNSDYAEGESVAYRSVMNGLTVGATYFVEVDWDSTENGGHHAIDYLTSYGRTETSADACSGVTCSGGVSQLAIPIDSRVTAGGVSQLSGQTITIHGGTFPASGASIANTGNLCGTATCAIAANPSAYGFVGTFSAASKTSTRVYFTATASTAVLAWGGHIASRVDWGTGNSASALSGSPYHMRVIDFGCSNVSNCGSGQMDRSLSAAAVVLPGSITIVKQASMNSSASFDFTASPTPLVNFSLVDDGTTADTRVFSGITSFGTYTVTESTKTLWQYDRTSCSVVHPNGGTQVIDGRSVAITLAEGEDVTCTWYNTSLAAPAISVAKTANPASYSLIGDEVTYSYVITNTGNTVLGPTQFTIDDDRINGGVPFNCGSASATIAVGETVSCTATYTVTASDITAESVTNTAFASGGGVTSQTVTATVTYVPPATTTTTSTTIPGSTTTTTTPITTTSAPAVTTTTIVAELQVINPTAGDVDGTFDVLFPEELPATGWNVGFSMILGVLIMVVGAGLLSIGGTRRRKSGDK